MEKDKESLAFIAIIILLIINLYLVLDLRKEVDYIKSDVADIFYKVMREY